MNVKTVYLMLLCMLLAVPACAEDALHWLTPTIGGNEAVMIVDNGDDWEVKLNLRAAQSRESEIKGRIYTGTRVEIYQDNGEWCTVGLNFSGGTIVTGDVMKRYLTPLESGFSALCPIAVAIGETEVVTGIDTGAALLRAGDEAYVLAVCRERYFLMVPGMGQGYAPVDAFEPLKAPQEHKRIDYGMFTVPPGGVSFVDEYTGEEVFLAGGLQLEDCWQIRGEETWHVTLGAGIQRTPRVRGEIPGNRLLNDAFVPFEGEVYSQGNCIITCVGRIDGELMLRRVDPNGDIFWAMGDIPDDAVRIDSDPCVMQCEAEELLSAQTIKSIYEYVAGRSVLDERTSGQLVTQGLIARCKLRTSLMIEPGTGKIVLIRAWMEDTDGTYVTGGDLDPEIGGIVRWGCNG